MGTFDKMQWVFVKKIVQTAPDRNQRILQNKIEEKKQYEKIKFD